MGTGRGRNTRLRDGEGRKWCRNMHMKQCYSFGRCSLFWDNISIGNIHDCPCKHAHMHTKHRCNRIYRRRYEQIAVSQPQKCNENKIPHTKSVNNTKIVKPLQEREPHQECAPHHENYPHQECVKPHQECFLCVTVWFGNC